MTVMARATSAGSSERSTRLDAEQWIAAALDALAAGGIDNVRVEPRGRCGKADACDEAFYRAGVEPRGGRGARGAVLQLPVRPEPARPRRGAAGDARGCDIGAARAALRKKLLQAEPQGRDTEER